MLFSSRCTNSSTLGLLQRSVTGCLDILRLSERFPTKRRMATASFPAAVKASFWRGGTSKGVFLNLSDLPEWFQPLPDSSQFKKMEGFFAAIMGSPDEYGRQLNGMGGGISSLSKAMVVTQSTDTEADVNYTFFQIGVKDGKLDMAGNCGNLTSAVGAFALNSGIYRIGLGDDGQQENPGLQVKSITMRVRNTNTQKIIESTFQACKIGGKWQYLELGKCSIDGVPGTGSTITLSFLDPAGSKTGLALPTGNAIDQIRVGDKVIQASLIDVSNPGVFIDGREVGWDPAALPEQMNANQELLDKLEMIRKKGTEMMGLDPNISSIPKIVLLFPPKDDTMDIACQALSMEQAHKAVPVTLALNLGVACKMQGTIPFQLSRHRDPSNTVIGHPSGRLEVGAAMENGKIVSAKLIRTARCHMEGYVNVLGRNEESLQLLQHQ